MGELQMKKRLLIKQTTSKMIDFGKYEHSAEVEDIDMGKPDTVRWKDTTSSECMVKPGQVMEISRVEG